MKLKLSGTSRRVISSLGMAFTIALIGYDLNKKEPKNDQQNLPEHNEIPEYYEYTPQPFRRYQGDGVKVFDLLNRNPEKQTVKTYTI